jgi:hypothetical protein
MMPTAKEHTEVTALDPLIRFSITSRHNELWRSHELLDDTMKSRALVPIALLPSSKGTEILDSLGHGLRIS